MIRLIKRIYENGVDWYICPKCGVQAYSIKNAEHEPHFCYKCMVHLVLKD